MLLYPFQLLTGYGKWEGVGGLGGHECQCEGGGGGGEIVELLNGLLW